VETTNIIGLAGLAFVVISGLLPYTPAKVPVPIVYAGLLLGFILLAICAVETWLKISPGLTVTVAPGTSATIAGLPLALGYGLIFASLMWLSVKLLQLPIGRDLLNGEESWGRPPSHDLLKVYEDIKQTFRPERIGIKIKIVATEKGRPVAESLAEFFKYCKWEMEVNHDGGSYIFLAPQPFKGALVKRRDSDPYKYAAGWTYNAVQMFTETPKTENFPETDAFNFVQIEIGDGPRDDW
jgi:hypothetical protein